MDVFLSRISMRELGTKFMILHNKVYTKKSRLLHTTFDLTNLTRAINS